MTVKEIINNFFPHEPRQDTEKLLKINIKNYLAYDSKTRKKYAEVLEHIPEDYEIHCTNHIHSLV